MKKTILFVACGFLPGIIGGFWLGVRICAYVMGEKIHAIGGEEKFMEFYEMLKTNWEPT